MGGTHVTETDIQTLTNKTPIDTPATELKISTASKGGLFNGDFETGTGSASATGWIGSANYGWFFQKQAGTITASFDSTVSHSGNQSMKIAIGDTSGWGDVRSDAGGGAANFAVNAVPVKPNTKYRFSGWVKTRNVATNAVWMKAAVYISDSSFNEYETTKLTGTNDWTYQELVFTTGGSAIGFMVYLYDWVAGNVSDAWFDDLKLEEVIEDTTFTGKVAEPIRPVFQAVTSTTNIDQNQVANNDTFNLGDNNGFLYDAQSFIPTKKYLTGITFQKDTNVGSPTFDVEVSIQTDNAGVPSGTKLASKSISAATWNGITNGTDYFIDLPCIVTAGTKYWIVFTPSAQGDSSNMRNLKLNNAGGYASGDAAKYYSGAWHTTAYDLYFKTHFAKKSESFSVVCNGVKSELKANNSDGLLNGAIIDLDNGKYYYSNGFNSGASLSDIYSASDGGLSGTAPNIVNSWYWGNSGETLWSANDATTRLVTFKINTFSPVKHFKTTVKLQSSISGTIGSIDISKDNVNWTAIGTLNPEGTIPTAYNLPGETDLVNGASIFYVRLNKNTANTAVLYENIIFEADLDTFQIPIGLFYPLAENRFTESVKLTSSATRIYYRKTKYANENGIAMPSLEFTDASANYIGYVPLKLNNTGEANPCIDIIIAETTNGQQVGTGSNDSTTGYILNDGEYMTLSSATDDIKAVYKVGTGTTSFANITKNRLLLSSNGSSDDATQDASLQQNVIIGVRQEGLVQTLAKLSKDVQASKDSNQLFGKTLSSNLAAGGYKITGLGTPASSGDSATKGYVDSFTTGLAKNFQYSYGTSDINDNSGVYNDMANMSVTITPTGGDVYIQASFTVASGATDFTYVQLLKDGGLLKECRCSAAYASANGNCGYTIFWKDSAPTQAGHVYKLQWKRNNQTTYNNATTNGAYRFIMAWEVK